MKMIKALIAFDARINGVNNSYSTPLDIVLDNEYHSVRDLLIQLGAMTSDEMGCTVDNDDSYNNGRVSPYTEVDLASRHLKDSEYYHFRPISLPNGYDPDPGNHDEVDSNNSDGNPPYPSGLPINGGAPPPPGGLNCHHEGQLLNYCVNFVSSRLPHLHPPLNVGCACKRWTMLQ